MKSWLFKRKKKKFVSLGIVTSLALCHNSNVKPRLKWEIEERVKTINPQLHLPLYLCFYVIYNVVFMILDSLWIIKIILKIKKKITLSFLKY